MTLTVREMTTSEFEIVIDYFLAATPEFLEILGVDPSRVPSAEGWRERFRREDGRLIGQRTWMVLISASKA